MNIQERIKIKIKRKRNGTEKSAQYTGGKSQESGTQKERQVRELITALWFSIFVLYYYCLLLLHYFIIIIILLFIYIHIYIYHLSSSHVIKLTHCLCLPLKLETTPLSLVLYFCCFFPESHTLYIYIYICTITTVLTSDCHLSFLFLF